jgi:hypothetical protein
MEVLFHYGFLMPYFLILEIATQLICGDLLGILKGILSYGNCLSGRSRRRSLMSYTCPA